MTETMQLRGTLRGHNGWVTQIATNPIHTDMILSCSRGKYTPPCPVFRYSCLIRARHKSKKFEQCSTNVVYCDTDDYVEMRLTPRVVRLLFLLFTSRSPIVFS